MIRILLTACLFFGVVHLANVTFTGVRTQQAWVSGEKVVLRSPIIGQIKMSPIQPGLMVSAGTPLFTVTNPGFGNSGADARLAWASDFEDRLAIEAAEAEVCFDQQTKIFERFKQLQAHELIAGIEFLEEQTKWELARTTRNAKREQLARARQRRSEAEAQVALQKVCTVAMPFDGVIWSVPARDGQMLSPHEPVCIIVNPERVWVDALLSERHAGRVTIGSTMRVRTRDGGYAWSAAVESMRGAAGPPERALGTAGIATPAPGQVAIRLSMSSVNPFGAAECYGVGRAVEVTLDDKP